MEFKVKHNVGYGWYIGSGNCDYVWNDLVVHNASLGYLDNDCNVEKAPGYYTTKAEAERYLRAYEVSQMKFIIRKCRQWPERGWYILADNNPVKYHHIAWFVWHDLQLHVGTGYNDYNSCIGGAPGYYVNQESAIHTLAEFKEKHMGFKNAENTIKINVESNGKPLPLHELSVESILKIREASKPKPVPVFQVCEKAGKKYLLLKLPAKDEFGWRAGNYIMFDVTGRKVGWSHGPHAFIHDYDCCELKLDEV